MQQKMMKDRKGEMRWHWTDTGKNRWYPSPLDKNGLPPVAWLRRRGAPLLRSELKVERHVSLCGKFAYNQGYRFDYYARDVMYKIPFFARSNEMRGEGSYAVVCWPIREELVLNKQSEQLL